MICTLEIALYYFAFIIWLAILNVKWKKMELWIDGLIDGLWLDGGIE